MPKFDFVPRRRFVLRLAALPFLMATAFAQESQPRRPVDSTEGTYRSDRLGFEYQLVPYRGHFGAKLAARVEGRSPFARVRRPGGEITYLEPGDMIVALDSQVIDGPKDVEAHVDETTVQFVNVRNGQVETVTAAFPPTTDGGGSAAVPPESRRVRALLVIDTASKLAGLDQDRMRMESLLDIIRAENRLDLTVLEGPTATPQQVLRYLRTQPDASADTMLVYYSGHGATDPTRGHALTFTNGGILLRSTLRAELARLRPRLAITLSDCCSNLVKLPPEVGAPGAPDPRPAIRSLFLRTYGVVDINGSTFDPASGIEESAWCQNDGGFFTRAVADAIFLGGMRLDRNRDGLLTWAECLPEIRSNLASIYGNYRKRLLERADAANSPVGVKVRRQPNQTPQAFAIDGGAITTVGLSGKALGVMVSPVRVGTAFAVRIDSINPGGPAALAGLEPGDVVLAIDGRGFTSVPEFQRSVATVGDRANLRIRNVRDGRLVDVVVSFGR